MPDHVTQFESWAVLSVHVLAPARTNERSKNKNAHMREMTSNNVQSHRYTRTRNRTYASACTSLSIDEMKIKTNIMTM